MIRRPHTPPGFALITQPDHAQLSGFLAQHIGNQHGYHPLNRAAFVAASTHHDDGWTLHDDDAPTLNAAGQPLHVFEIDMMLATRIWSASADRAAASLDPYAALLVSLHQLALSDFARRTFDTTPHERAHTPKEQFELNKFQHRQIELQESLRRQLGLRTDLPLKLGLAKPNTDPVEDALRFHFHLLTLCDRLSLQLCCAKELFPKIEDIEPAAGAAPTTLQTRFADDQKNHLNVWPWPFNQPNLSAEMPARIVPATPFPSAKALQQTLATADQHRFTFTLSEDASSPSPGTPGEGRGGGLSI